MCCQTVPLLEQNVASEWRWKCENGGRGRGWKGERKKGRKWEREWEWEWERERKWERALAKASHNS